MARAHPGFQHDRLKRFYRASAPPSLAGLPRARREHIEGRAYGRGVLIATRSCPHACGYCMLPHFYHHSYRCRPVEEVIAEAAAIQEKALIFWDDNIIGNLDYARELFRGLIPLRKRWTSQATFNVVDHDDLIQLAAASGCEALFVGLESITAASLRETGKAFNKPQRYIEGIRKLHDAGIAVQTGLVFGFDHDDVTVFERTLEFLERAGVDVASIGSLTPFPGTPLFRTLEAEGRILNRDWSKYNARTERRLSTAANDPGSTAVGNRVGHETVLFAEFHLPASAGTFPDRAVVEYPQKPRLQNRLRQTRTARMQSGRAMPAPPPGPGRKHHDIALVRCRAPR